MRISFVLWLASLLLFCGYYTVQAALNDPEFTEALNRAYDAGMTKYHTEKEYLPNNTLTREQAAKMYSVFGMSYLCLTPDTKRSCDFSDTKTADPTLQEYLTTACQLWLFQWSQGKFLPKQALTKAQALTVLVRALSGSADENGSPWWKEYFNQAKTLELTKETKVMALDKAVTRYESLLLQYRAKSKWCNTTQDNYSPKLLDILQEILWPGSTTSADSDVTDTGEVLTWSSTNETGNNTSTSGDVLTGS